MPPGTTWRQLREQAERRERWRFAAGVMAGCALAAMLGLFLGAAGVVFPWRPEPPPTGGICPMYMCVGEP